MNKILVIGSINMDYTIYVNEFPNEGETINGIKKFVQPGGKGANQAAACGKSKFVETHFLGSIGNDKDGKEAAKALKKSGVLTKLNISSLSTGTATIEVNSRSENKIIVIPDANFDWSINSIDLVYFKSFNSIILQNEIPQEINDFCLKTAHKSNIQTIYNPAPFRKFKKENFKYIDYLIVNEIELKQYSGLSNLDEGIEYLLNQGAKNVLVTLGSNGSLLKSKNREIKVPAFKVKPIDTVAAGDTFVGYFSAALSAGYDEEGAMQIASKAASITVSRKGSIVSIPTYKEIFMK